MHSVSNRHPAGARASGVMYVYLLLTMILDTTMDVKPHGDIGDSLISRRHGVSSHEWIQCTIMCVKHGNIPDPA